jgi:cysteine desulfurase
MHAAPPFLYLDYNSTTPTLPGVVEAMRPYWAATFANPASAHAAGRRARQALENARDAVAARLGAHPDEVVFTSGATEANNLALFGLAGSPPGRVITSPVEHPSVAEPLQQLAARGFTVAALPVDESGVVRPDGLPPLLTDDTRLTAVMLANNETGSLQPVADLVCLTAAHAPRPEAVAWHCDAVQAVGKVPVSFRDLGVTTLSLSAHKFYGPRGVGALLVRRGAALRPLLFGGHQQHGTRPGTEPVALAVGLAAALDLACAEMADRAARLTQLRQSFWTALQPAAPLVLVGPATGGLVHTLNVAFPGCPAEALLMKLDLAGVACSTGSACSSGSLLPSPVLRAMACPPEVLQSAMRFSLSHLMGDEDVTEAARRIVEAVRRLREVAAHD